MPIAISDNATITLSMHDWRRLESQVAKLEDQLRHATVAPPVPESERVRLLRDALDAALPVVQFAVGSLNPESVRDWPFESLEDLSTSLLELFADDADRSSLALTFRQFARECADVEGFRGERAAAARAVLAGDGETIDSETP